MKPTVRKAAVGGIVLLLGAVVALYVWTRPEPPVVVLPSPNGYDDLLRAGTLVKPDDSSGTGQHQLSEIVAQNAEALAAARAGLSRECMVPVRASMADLQADTQNFSGLKRLAQAFAAEGRAAAAAGRTNDALRSCLDAIRLGGAISRNGLLIDRLVGIACEAIGLGGLRELHSGLDGAQCRELIRELDRLDRAVPAADELLANERQFTRHAYPATLRMAQFVARLFSRAALQQAEASFVRKNHKVSRVRREFMITLAARAYHLDQGRRPAAVDVLVPDYLPAIPVDPQTGRPLNFAPEPRGDSP